MLLNSPEPIRTERYGNLPVEVYATNEELGQAAAERARAAIEKAIANRGQARIILATGNSQLTFLHALRAMKGIDWPMVEVFHMDEYLGIDPGHAASFPRFLREHLIDAVQPGAFHPIPSRPADPQTACRDYEGALRESTLDLVALGWGENGHLAFNDPPYADFDDPKWVKVVTLDDVSRRQQVGEGHFGSLDEVPTQAITLTIPALLAPEHVLCIVPEARKADAVHACLTEPVSENRPGSILREVQHARLFLDPDSSSKLLS